MSRVVKPLPVESVHELAGHPHCLDNIPIDDQYVEDHQDHLVGRLLHTRTSRTYTVLGVCRSKGKWALELYANWTEKKFKTANLDQYNALVTTESFNTYRKALQEQGGEA